LGTELLGTGASVRRASNRTSGGSTSRKAIWTGASEIEKWRVEAVGADSLVSDAAQQLSASAWLMARAAPSSSPLCIGQAPRSEQQAIRSSAVLIQPAQSPTLLAASASVRRSADMRRPRISTIQGCATPPGVSNCASSVDREKGSAAGHDASHHSSAEWATTATRRQSGHSGGGVRTEQANQDRGQPEKSRFHCESLQVRDGPSATNRAYRLKWA
jgi:hypothetical protein